MRVKAKIINYYCKRTDNSYCFENCSQDECPFCDKECVFIDKDYKKCTFYKNFSGIYCLELGNTIYEYDEAMYYQGVFVDTVIEYVIIDDELVFGEYKKEKKYLEDK